MSLIDRIRDVFGGRGSAADYGTAATGGAVAATAADEHDDVGADTGSDSGGGGFGGGDFGGGGGDAGGSGGAGT